MTYLYNQPQRKKLRRSLRRRETKVEYKLWQQLRNKNLNGYKFFRQYSVNNYILDFFCSQKRLAIELDGSQHYHNSQSIAHDRKRTDYLQTQDIRVLRIKNHTVDCNMDGVLELILRELEKPKLGLNQELVKVP